MFEVFTARALLVVAFADDEARAIGWNHIGSEHLLLGMLRERKGTAACALASAGIDIEAARVEMFRHISAAGGRTQGRVWLDFTPRAREVLEAAARDADGRGDGQISPGHVLLGMIAVGDGLGIRILQELGVDVRQVGLRAEGLLSPAESG